MSHYMTALAMRQTGLKPATKVVLYWLADHHNERSGECFPSIARLAELCEMSRRSVETHLSELEAAGLIERALRFREGGGKTSNTYILKLADSDAQNLRIPPAKSAHGDAQNLRMNNLGNNNLGNEPPPSPQRGRGKGKVLSFKEAFAEARATLRQQRKEKEDARLSGQN